jgi:hypothetical protein
VYPTGGSLRVFKQFAWLEAGSIKMALPCPTHQRVTLADSVQKRRISMILERTVLHCKPGTVRQMVDSFKGLGERLKEQDVIKHFRILTDLTGSFDTVVIESEIESIDAYFAMLQAMFAEEANNGEQDAAMAVYNTGHRTFYTIEETYEAGGS